MRSEQRSDIVGDHSAFERREYVIQRVGWWGMLAIVVAACLGVFGHGPLSTASATSSRGAARVEFERFARAGAVQRWRCEVRDVRSTLLLTLNRDYLDAMDDVRIVPEPVEQRSEGTNVTYAFSGSGSLTMELQARPRAAGTIHCVLHLRQQSDPTHEDSVAFTHFVYP